MAYAGWWTRHCMGTMRTGLRCFALIPSCFMCLLGVYQYQNKWDKRVTSPVGSVTKMLIIVDHAKQILITVAGHKSPAQLRDTRFGISRLSQF